jgi:hypothetical protein
MLPFTKLYVKGLSAKIFSQRHKGEKIQKEKRKERTIVRNPIVKFHA